MAWQVFGHEYTTAEATNTAVYTAFDPGDNIVLKAFRTWLIGVGDPTFTSVSMKIYSNNSADNTPGKLLHTSTNSIAKATLFETENHVLKETYFEFLPSGAAGISLRGGVTYNLVHGVQSAVFSF